MSKKTENVLKLQILDRLMLIMMLPIKEGSFSDHLYSDHILEFVKITKEDLSTYSIVEEEDENGKKTGSLKWDFEKDLSAPLEWRPSTEEVNVICKVLDKLSDNNQMTVEFYNIAKKFFPLRKNKEDK